MNKNNKDARMTDDEKNTNEMSEAEVDETVAESFPASDPPSWTLGSDHRAGAIKIEETKEGDEPRKS